MHPRRSAEADRARQQQGGGGEPSPATQLSAMATGPMLVRVAGDRGLPELLLYTCTEL